jgi:hypothetical protein
MKFDKIYFSNFYEIRYTYTFQIFVKFGTSILLKFLWISVEIYFSNSYEIRYKYTFQNFMKFDKVYFSKFYEIRYKYTFQIIMKFGKGVLFKTLWTIRKFPKESSCT